MGLFFLLTHTTTYLPGKGLFLVLKTFLEVQCSNMVLETLEIIWQPGVSMKLFNERIIADEFYCIFQSNA